MKQDYYAFFIKESANGVTSCDFMPISTVDQWFLRKQIAEQRKAHPEYIDVLVARRENMADSDELAYIKYDDPRHEEFLIMKNIFGKL